MNALVAYAVLHPLDKITMPTDDLPRRMVFWSMADAKKFTGMFKNGAVKIVELRQFEVKNAQQ